MVLFLVVVILKIAKIQYIEGDGYRELSERKIFKNDTIHGNRGNVYDVNENLLPLSSALCSMRYVLPFHLLKVPSPAFPPF